MDVWIGVLGFVLFLGFFTAVVVCINAIKRQSGIIIASRLHHKLNNSEVIYANAGLVVLAVLLYFRYYVFVPAVFLFVLFIVLSTRIQSGITDQGAVVGTTFIEWEFMKGFKLVNEPGDSNIIILKIRANRKQYVLVCDRKDRNKINEIFLKNHVKPTEVMPLERVDEVDMPD